jgi:hypothetical protein
MGILGRITIDRETLLGTALYGIKAALNKKKSQCTTKLLYNQNKVTHQV